MDVKNAFLYDELCEVVCMHSHLGLRIPLQHVCLFRQANYSLKQAPRAWFECLLTVPSRPFEHGLSVFDGGVSDML